MANDSFAALAEVAGGFIHEIKNHLGTLGLNLQLLAEDFQDPQSPRERQGLARIQKLQTECQRVVDVANDFLRFARLRDLNLKPVKLAQVVEELIDFFGPSARAANIDIRCYLPADLPPVALDADLFKQALLNLLLNAEQAMPDGGAITLQAAAEAEPPRVCLSVIDTGRGMTPQVIERIFQPFYSTRPGGTGLGLPTTRRIIEAHHGGIDVQSAPGKGTKVAITLPAAPPDSNPS